MKPLFVIFLILVLLFFGRNFFNLKKIDCELDHYPCPLVLEPFLAGLSNKNIFFLKRTDIIKQLSQLDPTFTRIQVAKIIPNRISIKLEYRQPIAQIKIVNNLEFIGLNSTASATLSGEITGQAWFIDKAADLYPVKPNQSNSLPLVFVPKDFNNQLIAQTIITLNNYYVGFDLLAWLDKFTIIVKTNLGPYAVIDPSKDVAAATAYLQYILNGLKIGERLPSKIDLRFDKPVLTY